MPGSADVRTIHNGRLFDVELMTWTDEAGREIRREIVRHPGAVLIVPELGERIVMIRNDRPAVGRPVLELPAGTLERGEAPADAAARELEEETGYRAGRLRPLGTFYTSPGFCDELMRAFVASALEPAAQRLEPGEGIEVLTVGADEALAMIDEGRIEDGKTIAALLMWSRKRAGATA